jgi:hypothetical protein
MKTEMSFSQLAVLQMQILKNKKPTTLEKARLQVEILKRSSLSKKKKTR